LRGGRGRAHPSRPHTGANAHPGGCRTAVTYENLLLLAPKNYENNWHKGFEKQLEKLRFGFLLFA
jgi:hypothetical protein